LGQFVNCESLLAAVTPEERGTSKTANFGYHPIAISRERDNRDIIKNLSPYPAHTDYNTGHDAQAMGGDENLYPRLDHGFDK
jgi:hypothetical protein